MRNLGQFVIVYEGLCYPQTFSTFELAEAARKSHSSPVRDGAVMQLEYPREDNPNIERILPNETALAIVRLFLEKLETLTADERKEILAVIRFLNTPMFLVKSNVGQHGKGCECLDCVYLKD